MPRRGSRARVIPQFIRSLFTRWRGNLEHRQQARESPTAGNGFLYREGMNAYPDGWTEKGTEAYWAKREADQAALRLQFIRDQGIPPKRPDPRERLRGR
jgi:hypothetical protein